MWTKNKINLKMFVISIVFALISAEKAYGELYKDLASIQIVLYNESHLEPTGQITDNGGAPVDYQEANEALNSNLIRHNYFFETTSHFIRENIPDRVVHAKGAGAFGYFEVTDDVTYITKAKFLNEIGKKTPVMVRFSPAITDKGGIDTRREPRGFAVKFYTEDGNFDLVGLHTPLFVIKDPIHFPAFAHTQKRNPVTNLFQDPNTIWDFTLNVRESINIFLRLFGSNGIPDGYRHMPGFSIHTYEMVNNKGVNYFARLMLKPHAGIKNLNSTIALKLAAEEPDYATKDLYNAIANGDYPCWSLYFQVLTMEEVLTAGFDVFDVTKTLSEDVYPLIKVGKMCLNKNPENYFADVEQAAFCPCTLVPGILGAPDKLFEARCFAYREAQMYRLGVNYYNIDVNYPHLSKVSNFNRNGRAPVFSNGGGSPNYYPNSYNGLKAYIGTNNKSIVSIIHDPPNNFKETSDFYDGLSEEERNITLDNLVSSLSRTTEALQEKAVEIFTMINFDFGRRVLARLQAAAVST